jgi:hypothetical protein
MSSVKIRTMLERLGFSAATATYLTGTCGINSSDEIAYLDGIDDVDTTIKGLTNPGGMMTTGTGQLSVTSRNNGIHFSIRAVANLKLCVYYLKHMERVQRKPIANSTNLILVRSYRDQQRHEVSFKKTAEEPFINDKDWPRTLETIKEYLASQYGGTGATFDYVVWPDIEVKPEAQDPVEGYETVDQDMTVRAPHKGRAFVNDMRKVWDIMSNICGKRSCFVYIKPALWTRNGREAYMLLFDHFLGPNNVGNMASAAETKLTGTLYNDEKKRLTWEMYVRIQTEPYSVLNGLKEYGYAGIYDSSKVRHLLKGIKTTELDVCKTHVAASPSLRDDFSATVELYSTFIKQMKAENPQLNVSEVSFDHRKAGKNSFGKRNFTGISNVSNAAVDDRLCEKHEYPALTPDQNNTLRLKRLKHGHVGKCHCGNGNGTGRSSGKGPTIKSLTRSIAAPTTKIDKFSLPDDDDNEDESSEEEEGRSNFYVSIPKYGIIWCIYPGGSIDSRRP